MDGEMERVLPDDADDGAERRWIDDTLNRLSRSSFRAKFELSAKDRAYARAKGKAMIDRHARELLRARIGRRIRATTGARRRGAGIRCLPRSMPPPRAAAGASPNGTIFPKAGSSPMPKSIAWRTWSWRG